MHEGRPGLLREVERGNRANALRSRVPHHLLGVKKVLKQCVPYLLLGGVVDGLEPATLLGLNDGLIFRLRKGAG